MTVAELRAQMEDLPRIDTGLCVQIGLEGKIIWEEDGCSPHKAKEFQFRRDTQEEAERALVESILYYTKDCAVIIVRVLPEISASTDFYGVPNGFISYARIAVYREESK